MILPFSLLLWWGKRISVFVHSRKSRAQQRLSDCCELLNEEEKDEGRWKVSLAWWKDLKRLVKWFIISNEYPFAIWPVWLYLREEKCDFSVLWNGCCSADVCKLESDAKKARWLFKCKFTTLKMAQTNWKRWGKNCLINLLLILPFHWLRSQMWRFTHASFWIFVSA